MDGCLWYFGGISSFLKAVSFGHTNKIKIKFKKRTTVLLFLAYYRMDSLYHCNRKQRIYAVGNNIFMQTFQFRI